MAPSIISALGFLGSLLSLARADDGKSAAQDCLDTSLMRKLDFVCTSWTCGGMTPASAQRCIPNISDPSVILTDQLSHPATWPGGSKEWWESLAHIKNHCGVGYGKLEEDESGYCNGSATTAQVTAQKQTSLVRST
jgi:hypothetical protein